MILGDLPAFIVLALACVAFLRWGCMRDDQTSPGVPAHGSTGEARRASSTGGPGVCRQCKDVR